MYLLSKKKQFEYLNSAVSFVLLLGSISAIGAAFLGWLIAEDKGYDADTLFLHRWFGIAVAVGSVLLWLFQTNKITVSQKQLSILALVLVGTVSVTGHLGGNLTHGDGYLTEHAPQFVKDILPGNGDGNLLVNLPDHPDSVLVYQDIISPILTTRCGTCHDESQKKGGFNVMTVSSLKEGGDNGEVIVPNKAFESELFKRTTLPSTHKKFMPIAGTPLSFTEMELIKWWINSGASYEARLTDLEVNASLSNLLIRDYSFDVVPKPFYEIVAIDPISDEVLNAIRLNGFSIKPVAENINYLDVSMRPNQGDSTIDQLKFLLLASEQVIWLNLKGLGLQDEHLETIGQLKNLIRLDINSNDISDDGLGHLKNLTRLESLNLYNTKVSDKGLTALESLGSLKRLYLWQTLVTPSGIDQLEDKLGSLEIEAGVLAESL